MGTVGMNAEVEHAYTTMQIATHFGVTYPTAMQWRNLKGFPSSAVVRVGPALRWNLARVQAWRANRPRQQRKTMADRLASFSRLA